VNHISSKASLISYLTPTDNKISLKLSTNRPNADSDGNLLPFSVISGADPFAVILEAAIVIDEDCAIQNAFLMIQKDEPGFPDDALWPVNNHDIDQAWQNSYSFLKTNHPDDSIIVLKDQVDEQKNPVRWRPLFYCLKRQAFFHPSCPRCGSLLDICLDDERLIQAGLQPYSTSLKRYLCCPQCLTSENESEFYVHSKDLSDPETVKDRKELIKSFGQPESNRDNEGSLPCTGCSEHKACYGTGDQALSRIVSVSFYPFYMLLHRAPTLHLLDFLPLISGAAFEDQKSALKAKGQEGRWTCLTDFERTCFRRSLFFFDKDERFFPEVLYLKLSLLAEISRIVFDGLGKLRYPDFGLSLERFWVSVAKQNPMLPFFWNFNLRPLGVGLDHAKGPYLPKQPSNYGLYVLGFIWFYVLLFNKRNPAPVINEKVAEAFERMASGTGDALHSPWKENFEDVFEPVNIFWDSEGKIVPPVWNTLWSNALDLGFRLLAGSRAEVSKFSEDDFEKELEGLRENAKKALFMPEPVKGTTPVETDQGIHDILSEIYDKWRLAPQTVSPQEEKPHTEIPPEDEDLLDDIVQETVILTPGEFKDEIFDRKDPEMEISENITSTAAPPQRSTSVEPESIETDDLPETVIVTPGAIREEESQSPDSAENEVPETMIVSPEKVSMARAGAGGGIQPGDQDDAEAREKEASNEKTRSGHGQASGEAEEDPDAVPETIIIKPGNGKP